MSSLDALDRRILRILQEDSSLSIDRIAKAVNSSRTPVWNRIQKMQASGVIKRQVALVDAHKVGLEQTFFVFIRTSSHDKDWLERFHACIDHFPEILEAHRMAGDVDYLLKVVVPSTGAFDAFYKQLISRISIFNVTSALSMETIKATTALPIADE